MIKREEKEILYFLQGIDGFGALTIRKIREEFGSYTGFYEAEEDTIRRFLTPALCNRFLTSKRDRNVITEYDKLLSSDIKYVTCHEKTYPKMLKSIHDYPAGIFYKGHLPNSKIPSIAVIGARNNTYYGEAMTKSITELLVKRGFQIISGMAIGIDGIAQRCVLANEGSTFAILGCGPNICYPASNRDIYKNITERGGIISEYVPGTPPTPQRFPLRNRIIAGLADVVIVIEARQKSGTLITVDMALEQGKDVFALPGRIEDALSVGCNNLIRQGASIITSPEEMVEELMSNLANSGGYKEFFEGLSSSTEATSNKVSVNGMSLEESVIYDILEYNPMPIDLILERVGKKTDINLPRLLQCLTNMTIEGNVLCVGGMNYQKK